MLFPIKNIEYLKDLNEAVSLQNQVQEVRLQNTLGDQNYHEDQKKLFEPVTDAITKTLTENSINTNQAMENLNEKNLELMNDKGMIAPY